MGLPCGGTVRIFVGLLEPDTVTGLADAVRAERPVALVLPVSGARTTRRGSSQATARPTTRSPAARRSCSPAAAPGWSRPTATRSSSPRSSPGRTCTSSARSTTRRRSPTWAVPRLPRHGLRRAGALRHPRALPRCRRARGRVARRVPRARAGRRADGDLRPHTRPQVRRAAAQGRAADAGRVHRRDGKPAHDGDRAERLRAEGVTDEELARMHAPIGLRIGARSPEEVAVAIAASSCSRSAARRAESRGPPRGVGT